MIAFTGISLARMKPSIFRAPVEPLARLGGRNARDRTLEQPAVKLFFQITYQGAHARLGAVLANGGP